MRTIKHPLFPVLLVALVLVTGFCTSSAAAQSGQAADIPPESIVSQINLEGHDTKGVSLIVHDVYYDGALFLLTVTMTPNDGSLFVCDGDLGWTASSADPLESKGLTPVGVYCEVTIAGPDGTKAASPVNAGGQRLGNAFSKTFACPFAPEDAKGDLVATVSYGLMEGNGTLVGEEPAAFDMMIPVQTKADTKEIALNALPEELSYLKQIAVAQGDGIASVFVRFAPSESSDYPIAFVSDGTEVAEADLTAEGCAFRAFRTDRLETFKLQDLLTGHVYIIHLADGTATPAD